jgi:hypothetical protein
MQKKTAKKKTAKRKTAVAAALPNQRVRTYHNETFTLTGNLLGDKHRSLKLSQLKKAFGKNPIVPDINVDPTGALRDTVKVQFDYPSEPKFSGPYTATLLRTTEGLELAVGCQVFQGNNAVKILKRAGINVQA